MSPKTIGCGFWSILGLAASSDFTVSVDTIGVGLGLPVSLAGGEFFCGSDCARKVSAQNKARSVTATCLIIDVWRNRRSNVKWQTLLARVWVDSNVTPKCIARFVPKSSTRKSHSFAMGYKFRRMANISFMNRFWDFAVPNSQQNRTRPRTTNTTVTTSSANCRASVSDADLFSFGVSQKRPTMIVDLA